MFPSWITECLLWYHFYRILITIETRCALISNSSFLPCPSLWQPYFLFLLLWLWLLWISHISRIWSHFTIEHVGAFAAYICNDHICRNIFIERSWIPTRSAISGWIVWYDYQECINTKEQIFMRCKDKISN